MKVELEPGEKVSKCPLDGSAASLHQSVGGLIVAAMFWVKCDNDDCGCTHAAVFVRADALARWNRRTK